MSVEIEEQLKAELEQARKKRQRLDEQLDEKPDMGLGQGNPGAGTWEMALARRDRVAAQIEELEEALDRVQAGTYGQCERCGQPIDPERLEILPTTTLCSACAEQDRD
jgi:DnaK suppressor protein